MSVSHERALSSVRIHWTPIIVSLCAIIAIGLIFTSTSEADALSSQQTLPYEGGPNWQNGSSVDFSADGKTAIVGTPRDQPFGHFSQGSATIYIRSGSTWTAQQRIFNSNGSPSDEFGDAVAISADGNTAMVGEVYATHDGGEDQGDVLVFTRSGSTWTLQTTLVGSTNFGRFGCSMALSANGNTAVIGAYYAGAGNPGTATIFTRTDGDWQIEQTLSRTGGISADYFGTSVALSGDGNTAVAGAPQADQGSGERGGLATTFTRSGSIWAEGPTITHDGGGQYPRFGEAISMSANGNTILAGTPLGDGGGQDRGEATVFQRSGNSWTEQQTINQDGGAQGDKFGSSVSLSWDGTVALVGAPFFDVTTRADQGSAAVFQLTGSTWSLAKTLTQGDGLAGDNFGMAVALSEDKHSALVGAPGDDVGGRSNQGSATVFRDSFSLSVSKAGTGTGTVSSTPAGIQCGATCSAAFGGDTVVTLNSTPAAGSRFDGWSGDCSGTTSCVTTLDQARNVTATYTAMRTLTVNKTGAGQGTVTSAPAGIDCGSDCSKDYPAGTLVSLTAQSGVNSKFNGWSGACSGLQSTCQVSLADASTVSASFVPVLRLTVELTGSGTGSVDSSPAGVSCGSDCSDDFSPGTGVILVAKPAPGSTFSGWTGACSGAADTCQIVMSEARSVGAFFSKIPDPDPEPEATLTVGSPKATFKSKTILVQTSVTSSTAGTISQKATGTVKGKKRTLCQTSSSTAGSAAVTLQCKMGQSVRKFVKTRSIQVTLTTKLTGSDGTVLTSTKKLTLKRHR